VSKNFAMTWVAGYIAPRHLRAIRDTGNKLVAAVDPHDSVGILDQYCFDVRFFTEFEQFDRHLEKPLVINPWNLDALQDLEEETGRKIYTILQLRVHPKLVSLREKLLKDNGSRIPGLGKRPGTLVS